MRPMADELRVILAGRTGLDESLRFGEGIELVRVPSALEALAEVGERPDSVLVIGSGAEPADEDYREAVRRLSAEAPVLHAGSNGRVPAWADATIADGADATELRRVLASLGRHEPRVRASLGIETQVGRVAEHAQADATGDGASAHDADQGRDAEDASEAALIAAVLRGREVLPMALARIERRLGVPVRFEASEEGAGVPVAWQGRHFGYLIGEGCADEALAREASWLAGWLRLVEQQAELRRAALTDPLTGAWNRRYFDRFLPAAIERARRARESLTLLVFDIDDFKRFNTEHGHAAGDEILIETVRLLRSVIRPSDRVCRIGGDEFCVIFHEPQGPRVPGSKPPENVYQISRRFQEKICKHEFPKLGSEAPATLSISGGLATYPWDGRSAEELLEHADRLALQSKAQGKNAILLGPGAQRVCGMD